MSQSVKSNERSTSSTEETFLFQSEIGLFLVYLFVRTAPLVAVVFYFTSYLVAALAGLLLLVGLLWAAKRNNHRFLLTPNSLQIKSSFWSKGTIQNYPYSTIEQVTIKWANNSNKRQWLGVQDQTGNWKRFRCDWLHQQDPPSVDEHDDDTPQHELFELLDEEDFYQGSIQQMAYILQQKGISVHILPS